jgi:hypothetical protein
MASFAERIGKREPRTIIQVEHLDRETRTALWNAMLIVKDVFDAVNADTHGMDTSEKDVLTYLWTRHFHGARDEMGGVASVWKRIKQNIEKAEWFDVLDLIEVIVKRLGDLDTVHLRDLAPSLIEYLNDIFERYLVGYRFIGNEITPIASRVDVTAIEEALKESQDFAGAQHHLDQAISLLSDRQEPDYANSIKESISAVEAVVRTFSMGKTLGDGLNKLETAGLTIHPALKGAWQKMYGWTSDEAGVRHGGSDAADMDQSLAKYMLVACSAFVSYLIEEANKKELLHNATGHVESDNQTCLLSNFVEPRVHQN